MLPLPSVATVVAGTVLFIGGAAVSARQGHPTPGLLMAGAGWVDVDRRTEEALELGLGYRFRRGPWSLRPHLAGTATSDRAAYGWLGVSYDLRVGRLTLVPSFGPGLYHRGSGIDLGHVLEFRSQLEVAYRLGERSRIGLSLAHMSNAGIGDTNPGTETITLHYSLALGRP